MSKVCIACGNQLADDANFCNACGAKQSTVQQENIIDNNGNANEFQQNDIDQQSSNEQTNTNNVEQDYIFGENANNVENNINTNDQGNEFNNDTMVNNDMQNNQFYNEAMVNNDIQNNQINNEYPMVQQGQSMPQPVNNEYSPIPPNMPNNGNFGMNQNNRPIKKKSKALPIILVIVLLLALVGAGIFCVFKFLNKDSSSSKKNSSTTVESVSEDFGDYYYSNKVSKYESLILPAVKKYVNKYDEEYFEDQLDYVKDDLEYSYGDDVKVNEVKSVKAKELDDDDIENIKSYLDYMYDVDDIDIDKAWDCKIKVKIEGDDDSGTEKKEFVVIQVGSDKYVIDDELDTINYYAD